MTSKELLDKYVRACIEIDREEKNYIPLRPIEVSLKEKDSLEKEILKRIDSTEYKNGINEEDQQIIESYMKGETPKSVLDNILSDNGIVYLEKTKNIRITSIIQKLLRL